MKSRRSKRGSTGGELARRTATRPTHPLGLIGRDVAERATKLSARRVLPTLIVALVLGLGVTALRIELIRLRYALAEATLEEQRLLDQERTLTADRRRLRDPVHLAHRAEELGFIRPEYMSDLPPVSSGRDSAHLATAAETSTRQPDRP